MRIEEIVTPAPNIAPLDALGCGTKARNAVAGTQAPHRQTGHIRELRSNEIKVGKHGGIGAAERYAERIQQRRGEDMVLRERCKLAAAGTNLLVDRIRQRIHLPRIVNRVADKEAVASRDRLINANLAEIFTGRLSKRKCKSCDAVAIRKIWVWEKRQQRRDLRRNGGRRNCAELGA